MYNTGKDGLSSLGPGFDVMRDLWPTKWHRDSFILRVPRFSSCKCHSTYAPYSFPSTRPRNTKTDGQSLTFLKAMLFWKSGSFG